MREFFAYHGSEKDYGNDEQNKVPSGPQGCVMHDVDLLSRCHGLSQWPYHGSLADKSLKIRPGMV